MKKLISLTLVAASVPLLAQQERPAGGKWIYARVAEPLTGQLSDGFRLDANEPLEDPLKGGTSGVPSLTFFCSDGRWTGAILDTTFKLGTGRSGLSALRAVGSNFPPYQKVQLSTDSKVHDHMWFISQNDYQSFIVDGNSVKDFLQSNDARIQFLAYGKYPEVATFSPAGLDTAVLTSVCPKGLTKK
jgi:hypothetical protein